jgi:hypothetical protein
MFASLIRALPARAAFNLRFPSERVSKNYSPTFSLSSVAIQSHSPTILLYCEANTIAYN